MQETMHTTMKVRINWSELTPALYGLGWQVIGLVLLAVVAPRLHATPDEVVAVIVLCVAVIAAQAIIHLIAAYVRMFLLLNRVAAGNGEQAKSAHTAKTWGRKPLLHDPIPLWRISASPNRRPPDGSS